MKITMITPKEAVDRLDPHKWKETSAEKKLEFLKKIRENINIYFDRLVDADCGMKGITRGDPDNLHQEGTAIQSVIVPVASNISACIDLYEHLVEGKMPEAIKTEEVSPDLYDVTVFPRDLKDKILYSGHRGILRIKGKPLQKSPLDKPGGITAVLGAGNYASSFEMVRALFLDNSVVVHKPHEINQSADEVWAKVFKPLVDYGAVSFIQGQGKELVQVDGLNKIYFTGGTDTAKKISGATSTELISECGGNNPCIIVPGDRSWTESEMRHHARQLATFGKVNGGAVCGRTQTIVTCKSWPQRREFLDILVEALYEDTPGTSRYYPDTDKVFDKFKSEHPEAKVIEPEDGVVRDSNFLLIEDVTEESFAVKNEAFCQVFGEVALDTEPKAKDFLEKAVTFSNEKLLGTLAATILVDDDTLESNKGAVDDAVTNLSYGGIAINAMPPVIWMNPYITWGGNEEGKEFVSGRGNFGNTLNFENVEKSIVWSPFTSTGHVASTNKQVWFDISEKLSRYAVKPSWSNLSAIILSATLGRLKGRDF